MRKIFLFAGTTEGREIASALAEHEAEISERGGAPSAEIIVFSATEYGGSLIEDSPYLRRRTGRLDEAAMRRLFAEAPADSLVIDATHPYATEVTENLKKAASSAGLALIRVDRAAGEESVRLPESAVLVKDAAGAAAWLSGTEGSILVTTGSKELKEFTVIPDYRNRVYARVLPLPEVIRSCMKLGFTGRHLVGMQGPVSERMNQAMILDTGAAYLVTKETGKAGGFPEKAAAAAETGCRLIVIGRPAPDDQAMNVRQCLHHILP
ncbi:MAG: precorrin-6A reductase [Eubacteriales bacterium]|jgi:precorrin-6Y C5,15-methyltransferase (decarboxylating)